MLLESSPNGKYFKCMIIVFFSNIPRKTSLQIFQAKSTYSLQDSNAFWISL